MRKIALIFIIFLFETRGFGQVRTDGQSIFKMLLFLDKRNVVFKGLDTEVAKNDSLYHAFSSLVKLKLDTLKVLKYDFVEKISIPKFNFYELLIYDGKKRNYTGNVTYKRKLNLNEEQFFGILIGGCDSYIIAINQLTGASYRLMGFNANDFLMFLSDFKEEYSKNSDKTLSTKKIINNYEVENLDFECLYNGLNAKEIGRKKYPCLQRAADVTSVQ